MLNLKQNLAVIIQNNALETIGILRIYKPIVMNHEHGKKTLVN